MSFNLSLNNLSGKSLFYGELHLNYLPTPNKKATLIKILN